VDIVNRIGEAEQERLGLFAEEMGESQLEIGKILRHGIDSHHPDEPSLSNAQRLELEAGHVLAAIELLVASGTLSLAGLEQARVQKLHKLRSWLHCGTNLDAVEELIGHAEMGTRHLLLRGSEAQQDIDAARSMLAQARSGFQTQATALLVETPTLGVLEDVEAKVFVRSLEQAIGDISPYQAIHALRRYLSERQASQKNRKEAEAHAAGGCDAPNIAVAEDGTQYCAHCGWNDPNADVTFACGKCGGRWAFAPSTVRGGWPPVVSGCCGSGAWTKPCA
jgi:hypothetical protein